MFSNKFTLVICTQKMKKFSGNQIQQNGEDFSATKTPKTLDAWLGKALKQTE